MRFYNVYPLDAHSPSAEILYLLLKERTPEQSISHKRMPCWEEHKAFVESHPYAEWYVIYEDSVAVGSIYLTKQREIGVFIFKAHQGKGYGYHAVKMLMAEHPGRFLWNVNPANEPSIALVKSLGGQLIQHTYEISP